MIGKAQILNPNVWKIQNHQFKVWKRPYIILNSNDWKSKK